MTGDFTSLEGTRLTKQEAVDRFGGFVHYLPVAFIQVLDCGCGADPANEVILKHKDCNIHTLPAVKG